LCHFRVLVELRERHHHAAVELDHWGAGGVRGGSDPPRPGGTP
jgi:hypothetical protein